MLKLHVDVDRHFPYKIYRFIIIFIIMRISCVISLQIDNHKLLLKKFDIKVLTTLDLQSHSQMTNYCYENGKIINVFCLNNNPIYNDYLFLNNNNSNLPRTKNTANIVIDTLTDHLKIQDKNIRGYLNENNITIPIKKNDNFDMNINTNNVEFNYHY